jgi:hypothetical protein
MLFVPFLTGTAILGGKILLFAEKSTPLSSETAITLDPKLLPI